jgi:hypothetical protein
LACAAGVVVGVLATATIAAFEAGHGDDEQGGFSGRSVTTAPAASIRRSSLEAVIVPPSVMLRKLAAYRRQNQLDLALQELRRTERTLFMLEARNCVHAAMPGSTRLRRDRVLELTYIADAIGHLRATEQSVPDAWLADTSPLSWENISFSGDFLWERAAATADKRRPV